MGLCTDGPNFYICFFLASSRLKQDTENEEISLLSPRPLGSWACAASFTNVVASHHPVIRALGKINFDSIDSIDFVLSIAVGRVLPGERISLD